MWLELMIGVVDVVLKVGRRIRTLTTELSLDVTFQIDLY